ncbi:MAG TPA: ABC transporter permease [Egibacteraceae bacterium]|nr:ABC transporter permease [Egibacteraceae bacterium]
MTAQVASMGSSLGRRALRSRWIGPLLVMLSVATLMALTTDRFLHPRNLANVSLQMAIVAIVAIGATIVILTAQIDLSSGSLVALVTVLTAGVIKNVGLPVPTALALMLLLGALLGLVNGFFSTYGRIPPFIFTLGTLSIFRGLAFLYTGGTPIFSVSPQLNRVFYARLPLLEIPMPFVYVLVLYSGAALYLRSTKGGRQIYAVGGNAAAARLSGINVNRVRTKAFVIAGVTGALGGILMTARLDSGSPNYAQGMELMAIAAAVIGGASLFGGTGSVAGTLFGAMTIVIVQNGLNLHGVAAAWQSISLGAIIAAAVAVDMWRSELGSVPRRLAAGLRGRARPGAGPAETRDAAGPAGDPDSLVTKER